MDACEINFNIKQLEYLFFSSGGKQLQKDEKLKCLNCN